MLLEDFTAALMEVPIEVIVDRGKGGGEFPRGLQVHELRGRCFSSPEGLVGMLDSDIEPPTALRMGALPITLIADRYERSRSVTIDSRPA